MTDPAGADAGVEAGGAASPGAMQSLRDLVGNAVAALQTRLQLLSVDAQEAGWRLAAIVLYGIVALFCLFTGTVLLALLIIVAFWDRSPVLAVALLSGFFLLAGGGCAFLARRHARVAPSLFAATLETLARDREALSAGASATDRGGAAAPR